MELAGIVRCPLSSLRPYGGGRLPHPRSVERLARHFSKTECNPRKQRNHIQGVITPRELAAILATLDISLDELLTTVQSGVYPLLTDQHIACLDGRQRLAAAARRRPFSCWVVKLLCVEGRWIDFPLKLAPRHSHIKAQIQDEVDYFSHEAGYSDAEIYRLIQKYITAEDWDRVAECRTRLSPSKEISLDGLLKNVHLDAALSELLQFPGVVGGLQLGNFHKHLALHCDENIIHYFREGVLKPWEFITDKNPKIKSTVDLETVQNLQYRTPATSKLDRREIAEMMDDGTIFRGLTDPDLRDGVRERILSLNVAISSVETFHENMKYFSLGAKILRKYLLGKPTSRRNQPTLFQSLSSSWTAPSVAQIEVGNGHFMSAPDIRPTAWLAYAMVFLAALRNFADFGSDRPRQDVRGESMPTFEKRTAVTYLLEVASYVGFDSPKIREYMMHPPGQTEFPPFNPKDGQQADWRAGVPFTKTYLSLQTCGFLDQLSKQQPRENTPNPVFILADIFRAFFGDFNFSTAGSTTPDSSPSALDSARLPLGSDRTDQAQPSHNPSFRGGETKAKKDGAARPDGSTRHYHHSYTAQATNEEDARTSLSPSPDVTVPNERIATQDSDTFDRQPCRSHIASYAQTLSPHGDSIEEQNQLVGYVPNASTFDGELQRPPTMLDQVERTYTIGSPQSPASETTLRGSITSQATKKSLESDGLDGLCADTFHRQIHRSAPLSEDNFADRRTLYSTGFRHGEVIYRSDSHKALGEKRSSELADTRHLPAQRGGSLIPSTSESHFRASGQFRTPRFPSQSNSSLGRPSLEIWGTTSPEHQTFAVRDARRSPIQSIGQSLASSKTASLDSRRLSRPLRSTATLTSPSPNSLTPTVAQETEEVSSPGVFRPRSPTLPPAVADRMENRLGSRRLQRTRHRHPTPSSHLTRTYDLQKDSKGTVIPPIRSMRTQRRFDSPAGSSKRLFHKDRTGVNVLPGETSFGRREGGNDWKRHAMYYSKNAIPDLG